MKILFDYQIFSLQKFGGISRYFVELMSQFSIDSKINFDFPLYFSNNEHLKHAEFSNHRTFFPNLRLGIKNKYTRYLNGKNKKISVAKIEEKDFDVFHPTYYDPYFIDYIDEKPFVLTVHDLTTEKFPDYFSSSSKETEHKKLLIDRASKIIAISANTKNDIINFFNVDEEKIVIIPLAASFRFNGLDTSKDLSAKLPDNYLLFIGNRKAYKNFSTLLEAYSILVKDNYDLKLVCGGGGNFTSKEIKQIDGLGLSGMVYYFPINDFVLKQLYANAFAFVFPSLYEGFGIPILESFECKCPVLLSNSSSFPEVAGRGGLYFDPENPESIKEAVIKLYNNDELRNTLIQGGTEKLKSYSWKYTSEMTRRVYENLS